MNKVFKIALLFLVYPYLAYAQDTIMLNTFEFNEPRKTIQEILFKSQHADSVTKKAFAHLSVADILSQNSQLFIKNYGPGSLATTAFRGASAVHTAILWNGININSCMNGQLDLSLLPVFMYDNISVQYGGTTALWGNAAVAGSIQLNNRSDFNKGLSTTIGGNFGSFDTYSQFGKVSYSNSKLSTSIRFTNTTSLNNFEFENISQNPVLKEKQKHAAFQQKNLMLENAFRFSEKVHYSLNAWHQQSKREIPPVLFQTKYGSTQDDLNTRIISELKYLTNKSKTILRNAFINEQIFFYDYMADKMYHNRAISSSNEVEHFIKFSKHIEKHTGVNYTYQTASSEGYFKKPVLNRMAFFSALNIHLLNEKLLLNVSARKEWMPSKFIPLTYAFTSYFKVTDYLSFRTNSARVYRLPTFNDLFWYPGGNPDLKPEEGFTHEGSIILSLIDVNANAFLKHTTTAYSRRMKNWIIWLPQNSIWLPQNLMDVWSRGIETESELNFSVNPLRFMFQVSTSYVVSTSMIALYDGDNSVGKQLMYVPMYSGQGNFRIYFKKLYLNYNLTYIGYRYTSSDNTQFLSPYWLNNIWLAKSFSFKNNSFEVSARINNLFNETYQVMLNRPMPLRHYQIGIRFDFN
ncbi:MAG: TonB-dependent receptor domain-containing protein [Bacteroidia bacterium]